MSYWNGQPLNANVFPQMGDLMQPQQSRLGRGAAAGGFGAGGWPGQATAARAPITNPSTSSAGPYPSAGGMGLGPGQGGMQGINPGAQMGMGDYSNVSSPLTCNVPTNFFSQGQSQYEPCIDNGEAFCAYNGMDMSMSYGGAQGKGGFW